MGLRKWIPKQAHMAPKSPHMARIGGSVYKDVKARDFYMTRSGQPSPMMRASLIYNLVNYRLSPDDRFPFDLGQIDSQKPISAHSTPVPKR